MITGFTKPGFYRVSCDWTQRMDMIGVHIPCSESFKKAN